MEFCQLIRHIFLFQELRNILFEKMKQVAEMSDLKGFERVSISRDLLIKGGIFASNLYQSRIYLYIRLCFFLLFLYCWANEVHLLVYCTGIG